MDWNDDYLDFLDALIAEEVVFVIVGAYALAAHGIPRATGRPKDGADAALLEKRGARRDPPAS